MRPGARALCYKAGTEKKMASALMFVFLGALWGGSFIAIKYAVDDAPALLSASGRLVVAVTMLALIAVVKRASIGKFSIKNRKSWLVGFFLTGLPFALLFWGEQYVAPGLAGIINGTVPIWTMLIGAVMLRNDKMLTPRKISGVILGFAGLLIIFLPKLQGQMTFEVWGLLALVGMAISYGLGGVLNRQVITAKGGPGFFENVFQQHVAAMSFMILLSLSTEGTPHLGEVSHAWIWATLYLGVFSTAIAMLIYNFLVREWGVLRASAVTYLVPVFALTFDFLIFGRVPGATQIAGCACIFLGLGLIQFELKMPAFLLRKTLDTKGCVE